MSVALKQDLAQISGWAQHDLDPNLVDVIRLKRGRHTSREDYIRRYGPRPEEAKWQANRQPLPDQGVSSCRLA